MWISTGIFSFLFFESFILFVSIMRLNMVISSLLVFRPVRLESKCVIPVSAEETSREFLFREWLYFPMKDFLILFALLYF